jgi:hypothetical protein
MQPQAVPYGTESPSAVVAVTSLSFATSSGGSDDDADPEPEVRVPLTAVVDDALHADGQPAATTNANRAARHRAREA